jgi:meckelin
MHIHTQVYLYVYEALFFLAIDMDLRNITLSALLTFIMILFFRWVRGTLGRNNISQKTVVDSHFLI